MKIEGNSTLQAQAMHQLQQQRLQKNTAVGRNTQDEAPATIAKGNSGQVQETAAARPRERSGSCRRAISKEWPI